MIFIRRIFLSITLITTSLYCLADTEHHDKSILEIKESIIKITPPGISNSAAYFTIMNNSKNDLTLVSASSSVAKLTEIHEHTMNDGLMKMRKVKSLVIPADSKLSFKSGGYHIMLMNLAQPIIENNEYKLVLNFSDGTNKIVTAIGKSPSELNSSSHKNHHKTIKHQH